MKGWGWVTPVLLALAVLVSVGLAMVAAAATPVWAPTRLPSPTFAPRPVTFATPVVIHPGEPTPALTTPTPAGAGPTGTLPPSPTPCRPPEGWQAITIAPGDTLESLAARYHVSPEALRTGNCLLGSALSPGSLLYVPPLPTATAVVVHCGPPSYWVVHIVQPGENLFRLSLAYGVSVAELQQANCLNSTLIYTGQRIYVPPVAATNTPFDWTPSATPTATATCTATATLTPTSTPTATVPTATSTATSAPPTDTPSPTATEATVTPSPTATTAPTDTPTPEPTATPTSPPTDTPTPAPTVTPTP